jgi:hypothetical protein
VANRTLNNLSASFKSVMFSFFVLDSGCSDCVIHIDNKTSRPVPVDFEKYIPYFLQDNPDESCAKAGHAAYGQVCTGSVSVLFRYLRVGWRKTGGSSVY